MGFKEKIDEACTSVGVSRTKLALILGKSQTGFNKSLNVGKFKQASLTEIAKALGVQYHAEFVFDDGLTISIDGKESILEDVRTACLHKGLSLGYIALALSYETERNFISKLTKGKFTLEELEVISELIGCEYKCEFIVQDNSAKAVGENYNAAVESRPIKELTEDEIKQKEAARLRKNARQREYSKKNGYRKEYISEYNKKNIKQINLNLSLNTDNDILKWLDKMENRQGYIKSLIRNDINKG